MKFATKTIQHYPPHLRNVATLLWEIKNSNFLQIHCVSKKLPPKLSVTLSNLNQFSKFLHCWKAYEICHKIHSTLPASP